VSRANARQRRGRAGRVRPGVALHLYSSHRHAVVCAPAQAPEVQRVPLEQLVLRIKVRRAVSFCAVNEETKKKELRAQSARKRTCLARCIVSRRSWRSKNKNRETKSCDTR